MFHHRCSVALAIKTVPITMNVQRLPTGLQIQFRGNSYNLGGEVSPNVVTETRNSFTLMHRFLVEDGLTCAGSCRCALSTQVDEGRI